MALLTTNHQSNLQLRLEELERRNQLLEAEVERLRVYKDYAYTDPLTEIPNRRFYYERLLQEIARSRRGNHALALALVDLVPSNLTVVWLVVIMACLVGPAWAFVN